MDQVAASSSRLVDEPRPRGFDPREALERDDAELVDELVG